MHHSVTGRVNIKERRLDWRRGRPRRRLTFFDALHALPRLERGSGRRLVHGQEEVGDTYTLQLWESVPSESALAVKLYFPKYIKPEGGWNCTDQLVPLMSASLFCGGGRPIAVRNDPSLFMGVRVQRTGLS